MAVSIDEGMDNRNLQAVSAGTPHNLFAHDCTMALSFSLLYRNCPADKRSLSTAEPQEGRSTLSRSALQLLDHVGWLGDVQRFSGLPESLRKGSRAAKLDVPVGCSLRYPVESSIRTACDTL